MSAALLPQTIAPTEPTVSVVAHGKVNRPAIGKPTGATLVFTRAHGSMAAPLTVNYGEDSSSTAISGVDFAPLPNTVVIPKGHASVTAPVTPLQASAVLPSEALVVDLQSGSYVASAAHGKATVLFIDKQPMVSIAATQPSAQENGQVAGQFTVTRTGPVSKPLTVAYSLDGSSTATPGVDFAALGGSVVIPKGQSSATITVTPLDAGLYAGSRTVVVDLAGGGGYAGLRGNDQASVTISDNDSPPAGTPVVNLVTARNASDVNPGSTGQGQFQVTRAGDTSAALTVTYAIGSGSTAVSGVDFMPLSGNVVIPAGQSSALINVTPIASGAATVNKTLVLTLTNSGQTNAALTSASMNIAEHAAVVTTPVVDVTTTTNASEVNPTTTGQGQFTVTRQGPTTSALTVTYTAAGTAVPGTNYMALPGSVVIPVGQSSATITVTPINDNLADGSKTVVLTLTNSGETNSSLASATMTIADAGAPSSVPAGWFNTSYHNRIPLSINVGAYARTDKPVDQTINFTTLLNSLGQSGQPLNVNSIRVVETSADGKTVVDSNVPFQFDQASGFDATTNATGDLVFLLTGSTAANATRYYHVYFDTGANFTAPTVTPLVTTTTNVMDANQAAVEIQTRAATYFLQTQNGGFSSIIDKNGQNWLNFNNTPGSTSSGEYRGFPNAVLGGGFHAGFTTGSTTVVSSGPLKTTLISTVSVNTGAATPSNFTMKYEIYPDYLVATMLQADSNYWFLYEGTPGGTINSNDTVVRSDGTVTPLTTSWQVQTGLNNSNTGQWAYFDSMSENRYLYMVQNTPDSNPDSYYLMDGAMTVFGFGRDNNLSGNQRETLSGRNSFTLGLADGGADFNAATAVINGAYQPLGSTAGTGQHIA